MTRLVLCGLLAVTCVPCVQAMQSSSSAAGAQVEIEVVDASTGRPITGGRIDVSMPGEESRPPVAVERSGSSRWVFATVPGVEYRVQVTALGYVDAFVSVGALTGEALVVELTPAPIPLPEIVASAPREGRIGTVHRLEREHLALRGRDLGGWLRDLPGFQVVGRGPGGRSVVAIRGSRPEAVEVLLDGVPLTDPLTGVADLSLVNAASLESVVATAGASDGAGWAGSSGTIRLQSRNTEPGVGVGVELGSFGRVTTNADFGVRAGGIELGGSVRYGTAQNDFRFHNRVRPGVPAERRVNSDHTNWGGLGRLSFRTLPLRLVARIDGVERGAPGRMGSRVWDFARWKERATTVGASFGALAGPRARRVRLSWSHRDQVYSDARVNRLEELRADQVVAAGDEPLPAGVDVTWRLTWAQVGGDVVAGPASRVSGGVRAAKSVEISPAWLADGSVSVDLADIGTAISPTVGLGWKPAQATRFWARASQGVRLPTFGDLYLRAGGGATPNPDLRPERVVIDGEVGAAYEPGRGRVRLTGATFFRHTRDPIIWLPSVVAVWSPINAGRLTAYGVETGLSVLLFPGLVLETNATVQSSRLGFEGYSNPLPYHPALSGGVALERSGAGPGVRLDLELEGARRTSVYGPHELPAVALLDLRANQGFRAVGVDAVIEIGLLNVLDVAYERVELFPEPGRTVEVRLSVRPGATPTLQAYRAGRSLRSPRQNR